MNIPAGKMAKIFSITFVISFVILLGIVLLIDGEPSSPPISPGENQTTTPPSEETDLPSSPQYNWEISGLTYSITEKNETWWKFAWQATLKNNTSQYVDFFVDVRFLDRDGFIIDDDMENPLTFSPMEQRKVRGYALIDTEIAPDVKDIEAEVTAYIVD